MNMTQDQIIDLLPEYVLGTLEAEEMRAIDEYVQAQRKLLLHLAQAEEAVALLAYGSQPAPLPASAKQRLMARVEADPPQKSAATERRAPRPAFGPQARPRAHRAPRPLVPSTIPSSPPHSLWKRFFNVRTLWNAMAAVAMIALALLGYSEFQLDRQLDQAVGQLQTLTNQVRDLEQENQTLQIENGDLQQRNTTLQAAYEELQRDSHELQLAYNQLQIEAAQIEAQAEIDHARNILVGSANRAAILFGTEEAPGLQGAFYLSGQQGALVVHGLRPLPADQIYQFWLVTPDGSQIPANTFAVNASIEPTWANISLGAEVPSFSAVGISIEPAGGSTIPTGPMLLESAVS